MLVSLQTGLKQYNQPYCGATLVLLLKLDSKVIYTNTNHVSIPKVDIFGSTNYEVKRMILIISSKNETIYVVY
jgi:hypothetical protein